MRLSRPATRLALATALVLWSGPRTWATELSVEAQGGFMTLSSASSSANAVFGSTGSLTLGGGVGVHVGDHLAASLTVRTFSKDGERVFVADANSTVFRLGHPLSFKMTPVQLHLAWRFGPLGKLWPYAGLGGGLVFYSEESTVGGVTESNSQTKAEAHLLGGFEYGTGPLRAAAEVQWSTVPNAIGLSGVSEVYGEKNLGGFAILARVVFVR